MISSTLLPAQRRPDTTEEPRDYNKRCATFVIVGVSMKLNEAILLGSTELRPHPGSYFYSSDRGCALAMAAIAVDSSVRTATVGAINAVLVREWPWLRHRKIGMIPCTCLDEENVTVHAAITHLFDFHVMSLHDLTLERLADWVRQQEDLLCPRPTNATPEKDVFTHVGA